MPDVGPIALIVNPQSGRGKVGRQLPGLEDQLRVAGAAFTTLPTAKAGHATELARKAVADGHRLIVAVGGDGTVHEVVNGMLDADRAVDPEAVLGVVAAGSGCDFARTFGLPGDITGASGYLLNGATRAIDVGKVEYQDGDDVHHVRYFVNIATTGIGGASVARAERLPRWLGRLRYLLAFWMVYPGYVACDIRVDGGTSGHQADSHNVVFANGQWFGGGMWVSPKSDPADGILDVQMSVGPKRQAFTMIPASTRGGTSRTRESSSSTATTSRCILRGR